jgi:hypothetical protein
VGLGEVLREWKIGSFLFLSSCLGHEVNGFATVVAMMAPKQ